MKKLFLSISILFSLFLFSVIFPSKSYAQTEVDCWRAYEQEDYKCFKPFNECINSCVDSANARTSLNVDGSKLYSECIKASDCEGKSKACHDKVQTNYRFCLKSGGLPAAADAKKETPVQTETGDWPNPRDLIHDYLAKEAARFDVRAPGYWEIKPEDFVIKRGAPKWGGGYIWIVEPRTKVWVQAKGEKEYKPFDFNTRVEPGSYIKTETPVDFWVKGVGLVQLRPGPGTSGMFAVEEINGEISPFLLMGEMEVKYGKPVEEATQKLIDWEQIKFKVRTPNSSVTVSRTHYLVRYDEKENETTVAVLEGKVEVVPNVGKPVTVTPKDGKPGVVVVTQKLSVVRLTVIGVVLAIAVGSVMWFLKKRTKIKSSKKR